jgi:Ubiquitin carboxyl-terminal hydrolase
MQMGIACSAYDGRCQEDAWAYVQALLQQVVGEAYHPNDFYQPPCLQQDQPQCETRQDLHPAQAAIAAFASKRRLSGVTRMEDAFDVLVLQRMTRAERSLSGGIPLPGCTSCGSDEGWKVEKAVGLTAVFTPNCRGVLPQGSPFRLIDMIRPAFELHQGERERCSHKLSNNGGQTCHRGSRNLLQHWLLHVPGHLFVTVVRGNELTYEKIHAAVDVPEELDLSDFLWQPDAPPHGASRNMVHPVHIKARYRLIGRVDHFGGSLGSGHFTSAVHVDVGGWLCCDDANVKRLGVPPIGLSKTVYLLLFRLLP